MENLPTFAPQDTSTAALVLDTQTLNNMMSVANIMATGISTVPKHLQKNSGDCLAVVMQAVQWGMNPFAVAQKTHLVNGVLGYEAQLVNAVAQSSGAVSSRFHYEYQGEGENVSCRVGATLTGEKEITWGEWLSASKVTTKNSPLWKTNPKQQLGYLQVKNWCRAFCPGAILGVYTPDELEEIDVTPQATPTATTQNAQPGTRAQSAKERAAAKAASIESTARVINTITLEEIIARLNKVQTPEELGELDQLSMQMTQADRDEYTGARRIRLQMLRAQSTTQAPAGNAAEEDVPQ
ncbi:recombinase RecT [Chitinibacter bivalviorum]|uniref:Recombinase RecT n=1 Tax=Chitinibacter bivalviorum TaxID=2739434 RepID=A0A7H9BJE4_9NEIS|nr:RecT family recombinase [Chitinibacter bivalviorum]QLG87674.1 recombinase RecT [Chitinibacter bivalviorum]